MVMAGSTAPYFALTMVVPATVALCCLSVTDVLVTVAVPMPRIDFILAIVDEANQPSAIRLNLR